MFIRRIPALRQAIVGILMVRSQNSDNGIIRVYFFFLFSFLFDSIENLFNVPTPTKYCLPIPRGGSTGWGWWNKIPILSNKQNKKE
jgi:hypothetical protein